MPQTKVLDAENRLDLLKDGPGRALLESIIQESKTAYGETQKHRINYQRYFKKRFGIRPTITTWPWRNAANLHLPLIDKTTVDPMGRKWIYDEWPRDKFHTMRNSALTPLDYKHLFRDLEEGQNIYRRIMDGRFCKQPMGAGGDSLLEIFDNLGIHFEPSYITQALGTTDPGYLKVKDALRVSLITNEPDLFVLRKCTNVIYSFQHNTWENYRDETKGVKETQSQFAKDFLDVIRYWLMDDPGYFPDTASGENTYGRTKWVKDRAGEGSDEYTGSYGAQQEW